MKRLLVGSALLTIFFVGGLANAAGWTGLYAGLNAGVGINHSNYSLNPSGCFLTGVCGGIPAFNSLRNDSAKLDDTVFTGGGQIGLNYQIGRFVPGIEADFNYNGVNESDRVNRPLSAPLAGNFIHTVKQKFDFLGTLRARLGFTPVDDSLVYLTGGLAYGHVESRTNVLFTLGGDAYAGSSSSTQPGWTVGGGAEHTFPGTNWSAKLEYLYVDLGSHSYSDPITNALSTGVNPLASYRTDVRTREHIIRLGFNYKFLGF